MQKIKERIKVINTNKKSIILSIGIAGFLTIELNDYVLKTIDKFTEIFINSNNFNINVNVIASKTLMFIISILFIFAAILAIDINRSKRNVICILTSLILISISSIIMVVSGKLTISHTVLIWILLAYIVFELISIIKLIYKWVLCEEDKMLPKLTLIWAILAFVLGLILK